MSEGLENQHSLHTPSCQNKKRHPLRMSWGSPMLLLWYCSRAHCSLNLQICCSSLCLDISISNYRFMHERNENTKCCSDVSDEETPHTFSTTATAENHYGLNLKKRFICGSGLLMVLISASSRYIQKWWQTYLKKPSLSMCAAHDSNPGLPQRPATIFRTAAEFAQNSINWGRGKILDRHDLWFLGYFIS